VANVPAEGEIVDLLVYARLDERPQRSNPRLAILDGNAPFLQSIGISNSRSIEGQIASLQEVLRNAPSGIVVGIEAGKKETDRNPRRSRCRVRVGCKPVLRPQQSALCGDLPAQILPRQDRQRGK